MSEYKQKRAQRSNSNDRRKLRAGSDPADPRVVQCLEKKGRYISKKRALAAAAKATKEYGIHYYSYRCKLCFRHHVTKKAPNDHRYIVTPIPPGEHNGRAGRFWEYEEDDNLRIEHFVDRIFHLVGMDTREILVDSQPVG